MKRSVLLILLVLVVLETSIASATSLLTNGSFQTSNLSSWTVFTTPNGTNGAGFPAVAPWPLGSGNAAQFNVGTFIPFGPYEGGGLTQVFSSRAGAATLGYDWATFNGDLLYANREGGFFFLLLDGSVLASYDVGQIQVGQTISGSFNIGTTLTAGTHTFEILIERQYSTCGSGCTPDQYVTAAFVYGPSTPELPTLAMFGSGLVGLVGVMRRTLGL